MSPFFADTSLDLILLMTLTAVLAGMIKGVVGFAMPMIFITGMTLFTGPDTALGILILPTLITNAWQAGRQGLAAAWASLKDHKRFLIVGYGVLLLVTQMVPYLSAEVFFLCLGVLVIGFSTLMLTGWHPVGRVGVGVEYACAGIAGVGGGLAGVWGPPTVMYLSTKDLQKQAQMRAQGTIYGLGAVLLFLGHSRSGIVNATTLPLSILAVVPACFGIWLGFKIQDRINQRVFKIATLVVLLLAGLNLIRRGMWG